jgi:hypothetical protein
MSTRFHGIMSVLLVAAAIIIAVLALMLAPVGWGWVLGYLLLCAAGGAAVFYAYCAKCPCKACCAHVLPGKVAVLFPRTPGPYSTTEAAVVIGALLLILGLPQLWIWRSVLAGVTFWLLIAVATTQILTFICGVCPNTHCPVGQMRAANTKRNS